MHNRQFFGSFGVPVLGIVAVGRDVVLDGRAPRGAALNEHVAEQMAKRHVPLRPDQFLAQQVFCFMGDWVERSSVIKYLANIASGAHSNAPDKPEYFTLAKIRRAVYCAVDDGTVRMHHDMEMIEGRDNDGRFDMIART